ncbi:MAG: hypothetical protein GX458_16335, partial [Phyllobacteriaceae bacterium]|nr:hypothetical protein [Phyllobacteriaceae bacterium]
LCAVPASPEGAAHLARVAPFAVAASVDLAVDPRLAAGEPDRSSFAEALDFDRALPDLAVSRAAAGRLAREIETELGARARVVVVSIGDSAPARTAARALVTATEVGVGLVDLAGPDASGVAGLAELIDGGVTFSEAVRHDPALDAWCLGGGDRPLDEADLVDPALAAVLDACAAAWGGVVIAAGRLEAGEGQTRLFVGADAVVLAATDRDDPRVVRVLDVFLDAGRPAWVLELSTDAEADDALDDPRGWAAAA